MEPRLRDERDLQRLLHRAISTAAVSTRRSSSTRHRRDAALPDSPKGREVKMLASLPVSAKLQVAPSLAQGLLRSAERLPHFDNEEFYSTELQTMVHAALRENNIGLDALIGQIEARLRRSPYCALVQGLSFDEGNKVFVGVNRAFGELVARPDQAPRAQLVHYIQPATDIKSARGGHESERLHTDTADWEPPVELISMVCVRADFMGGGCSRILDFESIREEVLEHLGPDVLQLLESG